MSKLRSILLASVAALMLGAVASATASAAGCEALEGERCLWEVEGVKLPEKGTKAFTASANKAFVLDGKAGGEPTNIKANKLKVEAGAILDGGNPGTGEATIVFEEVKVELPKNCSIPGAKITTLTLKLELVELWKAGLGQKVDDVLFEPKKGTTIAEFRIEGEKCAIDGVVGKVTGKVLAQPTNRGTANKVVVGHLKFVSKENEKEYRKHASATTEEAKLSLANNEATLDGEANIELVSKEMWNTD
jgi:hypothetical protein